MYRRKKISLGLVDFWINFLSTTSSGKFWKVVYTIHRYVYKGSFILNATRWRAFHSITLYFILVEICYTSAYIRSLILYKKLLFKTWIHFLKWYTYMFICTVVLNTVVNSKYWKWEWERKSFNFLFLEQYISPR